MSFLDANLPVTNVSVYAYRIRAVNSVGTSSYSNVAYSLVASPGTIDASDGLTYGEDIVLGLDPLANNSGFFPLYPPGYAPPPPSNAHSQNPATVTLLTPSDATLH